MVIKQEFKKLFILLMYRTPIITIIIGLIIVIPVYFIAQNTTAGVYKDYKANITYESNYVIFKIYSDKIHNIVDTKATWFLKDRPERYDCTLSNDDIENIIYFSLNKKDINKKLLSDLNNSNNQVYVSVLVKKISFINNIMKEVLK